MQVNAQHRYFDIRGRKHLYRFFVFADAVKFQSHFLKHCVFSGCYGKEVWIVPAPMILTHARELRDRLSRFGCPVVCSKLQHDWDSQKNPCGMCGLRLECFEEMRDGLDGYAQAAESCIEKCFEPETVRHAHISIEGRDRVVCMSDGFVKVYAGQIGRNRFNVQTCHSVLDCPPTSEMVLRNKRFLKVLECRKDLKNTSARLIFCSEERWCPSW